MKIELGKVNIISGILVFLCGIYGVLCAFLYYNQSLFYTTGVYESDLAAHISMAVNDHWYYSFTAYVYDFLSHFHEGSLYIGIFLAVMTVGTIYGTYLLFRELLQGKRYKSWLLLILAIVVNFVMPFYVASANLRRYIGYQSASIWHNSTYICMKCLAVFVFLWYLKLDLKYKAGLKAKEWVVFAALLAIATGIKPSFLMVFAPVMAIYLFIDLCHKTSLFKIIVFGLTVFPSLFVVIWQEIVLFGGETGNGFELKPFYTLAMHSDNPKVSLVLSMIFPGAVMVFHLRDLWKDKVFGLSWLMWFFGFMEVFLLCETGNRAKDANFMWGYSIGIFFVFVTGIKKLVEDYFKIMEKRQGESNTLEISSDVNQNKIRITGKAGYVYLAVMTMILVYQTYCGIYYFTRLLTGTTYWM